ncbi:MAG: protein kinase [Polyangiaceae bacterium]
MGVPPPIAGRFELQERAGVGGMGAVFRALDRETGLTVALKLLHPGQARERFLREADVLATLQHDAIVNYVAHGETARGQLFLAMEWLEGHTLADVLSRRRLTFAEAWVLAQRVASGLAAAHREGVVHRDIKPSNLFLPEGQLERAKIIDFGVARRPFDPMLTEVGLLIGTLAYMSPEQASGERNPEPSSDVFSLGSLLFRALTGENPFVGEDATAILAKILLDEPPRTRALRSDTPPPLDTLVAEMLSKNKSQRARDGDALLLRIAELRGDVVITDADPAPHLGDSEQRAVWVLIIGGGRPEDTETRNFRASRPELDSSLRVAAEILELGGSWNTLADGSIVASFVDTGDARGTRAMSAAHALRRELPLRPMAMALGLGVVGGRTPWGTALDRATKELGRAAPNAIALDDDTALSLGLEHVERDRQGRFLLATERSRGDGQRHFLGRQTPCVGRDRELSALLALAEECFDEAVARAAIVVGEAGLGKSRVRYEFLQRLRRQYPDVTILMGRADVLSAGSPFGSLREALRRHAGILEGEAVANSQAKLLASARRALGSTRRALEAAQFLGELANVPFDDAGGSNLRAVRNDPTLLGDAIRSAWLDFIGGASGASPVVIVLEDLHWGDRPTAALLDATLATHAERPILLLALARPEIFDLLPKLWHSRGAQTLRLRPLHRNAATRLVQSVLPELGASTLDRIVELADGNAFFLEELIRSVSEGRSELPATVVGVVQARLDELSPPARRLLRAASILGARFWRDCVAAMIGADVNQADLEAQLSDLVARELCTFEGKATYPDQDEYAFRHTVVRETAYASLTPEDRELGHRLAGHWLLQRGANELVLAEHFRRGSLPELAARHFAAAAAQALEGHDLVGTLERADLAAALEPDGATRGELARLRAHALLWQGNYQECEREALKAQALLERGSERWFSALSDLCSSAGSLDHEGTISEAAALALSIEPRDDDQRVAQVMCLAHAVTAHLKAGQKDKALDLLTSLDAATRAVADEPATRAWQHHAHAAVAYFNGDPLVFRSELERAIAEFDACGDARTATNDRVNLGFVLVTLGELEQAEALLQEVLSLARRLGLRTVETYSRHNLGLVRLWLGDAEGSLGHQSAAIEQAVEHGEAILEGSARAYLALALVALARLTDAETEAARSEQLLAAVPGLRPLAVAVQARVLLEQGKVQEACTHSAHAAELLAEHGSPEDTEALVHATWAEANRQAGDLEAARRIVKEATDRLSERARALSTAEAQQKFLERVPAHAELLRLARQLGVAVVE